MFQRKENKSTKVLVSAIKLCIAAGALFFIYWKVTRKENILDVLQQFKGLFSDDTSRWFLLLAFVLMPVNWALESIKWRMLIRRIEGIKFVASLEAVFAGLTVSFFTPNRIGEYAGRIMYLSPGNRIKGTLLTVIENIAQLVVTLVLGSIALPVFLSRFGTLPFYLFLPVAIVSVLFAIATVLLFLRISSVNKFLLQFSWLKKFERFTKVSEEATPVLIRRVLALAFLRFVVFSGQLYLLLLAFDVQVGYPAAMLMIVLTFLVMTIIPTFAFTDLGVRGAAGTFFFGYLAASPSGVVNATLMLWLINLALPAAIGAVMLGIVSPKMKKRNGYF